MAARPPNHHARPGPAPREPMWCVMSATNPRQGAALSPDVEPPWKFRQAEPVKLCQRRAAFSAAPGRDRFSLGLDAYRRVELGGSSSSRQTCGRRPRRYLIQLVRGQSVQAGRFRDRRPESRAHVDRRKARGASFFIRLTRCDQSRNDTFAECSRQ